MAGGRWEGQPGKVQTLRELFPTPQYHLGSCSPATWVLSSPRQAHLYETFIPLLLCTSSLLLKNCKAWSLRSTPQL